jgi:hypothetical protein
MFPVPCYVVVLVPLSGIFFVGWKYQTWRKAEIGHCKGVFLLSPGC